MRHPLLAIPLILGGCGQIDAYPVTPHEGLWRIGFQHEVEDRCGLEDGDTTFGEIWVEVDDPSRAFTLWVDDSEAASCTQEGVHFECEAAVQSHDVGGDAIVTLSISTRGWFDGPMAMSGQYRVKMDCEGSGCPDWAAERSFDVPCAVYGDLEADGVKGVGLEDR